MRGSNFQRHGVVIGRCVLDQAVERHAAGAIICAEDERALSGGNICRGDGAIIRHARQRARMRQVNANSRLAIDGSVVDKHRARTAEIKPVADAAGEARSPTAASTCRTARATEQRRGDANSNYIASTGYIQSGATFAAIAVRDRTIAGTARATLAARHIAADRERGRATDICCIATACACATGACRTCACATGAAFAADQYRRGRCATAGTIIRKTCTASTADAVHCRATGSTRAAKATGHGSAC